MSSPCKPGCRCWQEKRDDETQTEWTIRMVREEPLRDLRERLEKAYHELSALADDTYSPERETRLWGKCEGVSLAISYLEEMLRG